MQFKKEFPKGMQSKRIFIIILNWNQKEDALECLSSVTKIDYTNYKVILVDNGSIDGSQEAIKNNYPEVVLIENKENLGYANGNNVGIKHALKKGADYIFILNNDTVVDSKTPSLLVDAAEEEKNIGIVGPKIYYCKEPNRIQSVGGILDRNFNPLHRGFKEIDKDQFEDTKEVDFVSGSAMLIKREVFDKIGFFDSQFFMYWEETDFCYRARKQGFRIVVVPKAKIWHKGGVSSTPLITYYTARNKLLLLKKHKLGNLNILKVYISSLRTILSWTIRSKWKGKRKERNMLVRALCDFCLGKKGKVNI